MRTTVLLLLVIAVLALREGSARAQQPKKVPRIGWISALGSKPGAVFLAALRERGYIEAQNIIIEYRAAAGREDRLSEIAAELIRLNVDVILADTNAATTAAAKATTTIPIVFLHGDPCGVVLFPASQNREETLRS